MRINKTSNANNTTFGYKASFNAEAFEKLSKELMNPLDNYSTRIIKDVNEGLDSFNGKIQERAGVPNLFEGRLVIDDVKTRSANRAADDKIKYGFSVENLPDKMQKFINEDIQLRPEKYYLAVKNSEYNKINNQPFEKALNLMFKKIKAMIDKYTEIEKGLDTLKNNHVG